jgi:RecB family exonuclease
VPDLLSTRTFDVAEAEEVAPSPIYLQLREQRVDMLEEETPVDVTETLSDRHISLLAEPKMPLVGEEATWRAAEKLRRQRAEAPTEGSPEARVFPGAEGGMTSEFPWIADGRWAEEQRRSDEYTAYDGLLSGDVHAELDILNSDEGAPLSASRLEMLAASPYAYFLKYELGVTPLDEPALDDVLWIDQRKQGTILHKTFRGFMASLRERGETATLDHESELMQELSDQMETVREQIEPPSEAVAKAMERRLAESARVFLKAEARYNHAPQQFELGFGFENAPHRDSEFGPATLDLGDGISFELRGQIDRVDRADSGGLVLWDYKTGSASPFEGDDAPLMGGEKLQWALYAYAAEDLLGESVQASGYFFTSTKELGARIAHDPAQYRDEVAAMLHRLSEVSRSGSFPMNLDSPPWMFGDYNRIVPDTELRDDELEAKTRPDSRPMPPHLDD